MFDMDSIDLATILEEAEPAIDAYLDTAADEEADIEMTTSADDLDDITLDAVIGVDGVISDKDIEDIDAGKIPQDANNTVDEDADEGENDPEIFRLQKDIMQNTLLTPEDVKELNEGMSIEEFTTRVLQEDEIPVEGMGGNEGVCPECNCSPCVCDTTHTSEPVEVKDDDEPEEFSIKSALSDDDEFNKPKLPEINVDDDLDFHLDLDSEIDSDDDGVPDDDEIHHDFRVDNTEDEEMITGPTGDLINAKQNEPPGPVQPLFDNNSNEDAGFEDSIDAALIGLEMDLDMIDDYSDEGDVTEMEERDFNEAYNQGVDDAIDAILEEMEDAAYNNDDIFIEDYDEDDSDSSLLEDFEVDGIEDLDVLAEGLEDIDIDNKFEGSGINDKQWGPDDFLVGPEGNVDERGLGSNQNDDSLQFDGKTVTGFDDMDEDPSIDDMRIR